MRLGIIGAIGVLLLVVFGCGGGSTSGSPDKVQVVTSLPLFADFVRQIGGDHVQVTPLVPTGADPHTWEPSPADIQRVAEADLAFANGLNLDPAAVKVLEANLQDSVPFVKLGEDIKDSNVLPDFDPAADSDPHLWMDPRLAGEYARTIMTTLNVLDTEKAPAYKDNLTRYYEELDALRMQLGEAGSAISDDRRKLVTTHKAFSHLAHALNSRNPPHGTAVEFEVVAVVAEGPGHEPSPEDIADLARTIEAERVPAVFVEPQIDEESEILRQAAENAGVQVCTLYSDSLDDEVTSYIELMRFNADELARCLGGGG